MGRRTKCTPEVTEVMAECVKLGMPISDACKYAVIDEKSHYRWMRDGEDGKEGPFREYFLALTRADGDFVRSNLEIIRKGAAKKPAAAQWLLERRRAEDFGDKSKVEISGPNGGPVQVVAPEIHQLNLVQLVALGGYGRNGRHLPPDLLPGGIDEALILEARQPTDDDEDPTR